MLFRSVLEAKGLAPRPGQGARLPAEPTIKALAHYLKWSDDSGVLVEPSQVVGSLQGRVQDGWF